MSYKIEIMDEYSFGEYFSHDLRFETEQEAEECSQRFGSAGWNRMLDLRIAPSGDPLNARWTGEGLRDKDGQPVCQPQPAPTIEEIRAEAKALGAAWNSIVDRLDASPKRKASEAELKAGWVLKYRSGSYMKDRILVVVQGTPLIR